MNCGATSPFTLQSEVKHSPPNREAFVLWRHSTSGMGMTTEDCAREGFLPEQRAVQERGQEDVVQV